MMGGATFPGPGSLLVGLMAVGMGLVATLPATAQTTVPERSLGDAAANPLHASPYLPLGHWAYPVLDHWIASGQVPSLSPFTRPYRRWDVAVALRELAERELGPGEQARARTLEREFREELDALDGARGATDRLWADLSLGVGLYSQTHPDPLRPELDGPFYGSRALEHGTLDLGAGFGNVAAGVRLHRDGRLRNDPRFPDGRVVLREGEAFLTELELRVEEAYVEIQGRRARLSFGRSYRNWGAAGTHGLLRSNAAFSYDEIAYRFGSDRLFLTGAVTSLPDATGDTVRFHAAHRLEARLRENLVVAVSEASTHGGAGVRLDPRLISPLAIWELARDSERTTQSNLLAQLDVWWRPDPRLVLFGSLVGDSPPGIGACCESGGTLGMELPRLREDLLVRAHATAIQSLVYRTRRPWEEHSFQGIGLGWDKADLVLVTLEGHWLAGSRLSLRPRLDLQLLGEESDFRGRLRPGQAGLEDFPGILVGRHETTLRPSLGGRWRSGDRWTMDVTWDVGVNRIRHVGHQEGVHHTTLVGGIRLSLAAPRIGGAPGESSPDGP
jgi:hypothetical protein